MKMNSFDLCTIQCNSFQFSPLQCNTTHFTVILNTVPKPDLRLLEGLENN
jgi:hypothetical protein